MNEWLITNLQQQSHYLGDCPQCSALCADLAFDAVLGTPLGLAEIVQKRLKGEAKRSVCFQLFSNSKAYCAWAIKHLDWFGYERTTQ